MAVDVGEECIGVGHLGVTFYATFCAQAGFCMTFCEIPFDILHGVRGTICATVAVGVELLDWRWRPEVARGAQGSW